jgi:hypothetical protein
LRTSALTPSLLVTLRLSILSQYINVHRTNLNSSQVIPDQADVSTNEIDAIATQIALTPLDDEPCDSSDELKSSSPEEAGLALKMVQLDRFDKICQNLDIIKSQTKISSSIFDSTAKLKLYKKAYALIGSAYQKYRLDFQMVKYHECDGIKAEANSNKTLPPLKVGMAE